MGARIKFDNTAYRDVSSNIYADGNSVAETAQSVVIIAVSAVHKSLRSRLYLFSFFSSFFLILCGRDANTGRKAAIPRVAQKDKIKLLSKTAVGLNRTTNAAAIPSEFSVSESSPIEYARNTTVSIVTDLTALTGNPRMSRYPSENRISRAFLKLRLMRRLTRSIETSPVIIET